MFLFMKMSLCNATELCAMRSYKVIQTDFIIKILEPYYFVDSLFVANRSNIFSLINLPHEKLIFILQFSTSYIQWCDIQQIQQCTDMHQITLYAHSLHFVVIAQGAISSTLGTIPPLVWMPKSASVKIMHFDTAHDFCNLSRNL